MNNTPREPRQDSKQPEHTGEAERDNDALRPDGSTGTQHDSTAQKAARGKGKPPGTR
ncbi:hypothetical protein NJC40_24345 [Pseudomonas sp. 21LCFQ02]|uniref:hypothetical protein n=1 Tax=unclassified Pseudomonas TaxID=196821 RepID=UPI0020977B62|nr:MULTISPECIES: hypothetical protein [unclassified Pseudomonas]MCO8164344.1 hypothetical protein [Pseudomonas sp. 21LCFQ010]MCO8170900.1 hypothetical protein [Pseudomonas sp. 21LCFQ02]